MISTGDRQYKETFEVPPSDCGCAPRHWVVLYYEDNLLKAKYCTSKEIAKQFEASMKHET